MGGGPTGTAGSTTASPFAGGGTTSGGTGELNAPLALGGAGSSLGALIGLPQAGSVSPEEAAWVGFTHGENVDANAAAFSPGTGASTMHTQADVGAEAGSVLQTMRINDAMKAASQEFANAQKGAIGSALGGLGSALGGITRLAGV